MSAVILACFTGPAQAVGSLFFDPIVHQFKCLWNFTGIIDSLKDEAKLLDDAIAGLEGQVRDGKNNLQEPIAAVEAWLAESNTIKDEMIGILEEATDFENIILNLGARLALSKRAKETSYRTKELLGGRNFNPIFKSSQPVATKIFRGGKDMKL